MVEMMGRPAPEFSLTDLQGQPAQLAAWHGTPVLLNFFKSDCAWCQAEMPKFVEVCSRHPDLDLKILGIAVGQDDATSAANFAAETDFNFPIALDSEHTVRELYALQRVPTLVLINAAGNIIRIYEGASEQLSGIIEQTLLAAARGDQPPDYHLVGNGCAPD